jgi:sec-independent protein translocase protein TatA
MVVLILFGGRGKLSQLMGDFGKGLRSFKKSMREDESFDDQETASREQKALPNEPLASDPVRERDRAARP